MLPFDLPRVLMLTLAFTSGARGLVVSARAEADPYAINPFRVQHRTAPADPAIRWDGFKSRVGTYLPTDQYHWWRFDINDRAEVQDVFWNVTAAGDMVKGNWNGAYPSTPGDVTQAWRDAFMRYLNLNRYFYSGADAQYLEESSDPSARVGTQAAALIQAQRPGGYKHFLADEDFPAGFQYVDGAKFYSQRGNLGGNDVPSDLYAFLMDGGNIAPGHRFGALNPHVTVFAFGKVGDDAVEAQRPYSTLVYFSHDMRSIYGPKSDINYSSPDPTTCPPPPQYDPFDYVSMYPYRGYMALDENAGGSVPYSIQVPSGGLKLDPNGISITVTLDGVALPVRDVNVSGSESWHQHVAFTVSQGGFLTELAFKGRGLLYRDQVIEVTINGLKFRTDFASTPTGRDTDMAPYIAASDPRAFQPHAITWKTIIFDPLAIVPAPYPSSKSEITNLSTRAAIGSGDNVMIAGFVVTGNEPIRVAIRAQGPGLAQFGITNPAVNPRIDVYQLGTQNVLLGRNDDWKINANHRLVQSYSLNPTDDREPVAIATLMPGNYSAIVSDPGNSKTGVGIVEVFALDAQSQSRMVNVSTRALIGSAEDSLIGGFYIQTPTTVVIRAQGPSLRQYGITHAVNGTRLSLHRQSDGEVLATNAGWHAAGSSGNERFLTDLASYAPGDTSEAAQIITLPAGAYSAVIESSDGNPGIGIVEIFKVD